MVLDTLGAMLAASSSAYSATRVLVELARRVGGRPESSLVGQRRRTDCVTAALVNGTLGYYCDIEPHHVGAILHAPAVTVPTALAVAEATGASGARFLEAAILGTEVACRVSFALGPTALYARGFHPTSVCGVFGAAASSARLFGLPGARVQVALGLALQQASGLLAWASDPTENSRPLNPGLAARNGVTAAVLARLGFGGPPTPFEGTYDAFTAFSGERHPEALTDDWGRRWHLRGLAYKRYASCAFTHPGLDALLGLAAEHRLRAPDVEEIVLRFPAAGAHMIDDHPLKSHCAQYVLPVGLVFGQVMIDDILQDRTRHPEVRRLTRRTRLVRDASLDRTYPERYASVVELRTRDGRRLSRRVDYARGAPESPLTPDEVREKYRRLASSVARAARVARLEALVDDVERLADLRELAACLRGTPAGPRALGRRAPGRPLT
jgi:2-methylcitrate dehydratase PrpD